MTTYKLKETRKRKRRDKNHSKRLDATAVCPKMYCLRAPSSKLI